jgi:hypothetical protein
MSLGVHQTQVRHTLEILQKHWISIVVRMKNTMVVQQEIERNRLGFVSFVDDRQSDFRNALYIGVVDPFDVTVLGYSSKRNLWVSLSVVLFKVEAD